MPQTRSQSNNTGSRSKKGKKDGSFIDNSFEDTKETKKALKEVEKICKKLRKPKISLTDSVLTNASSVEDYPETEIDPDFEVDLDDLDDSDSLEYTEDPLVELEYALLHQVGKEKYEQYLEIKKALTASQPNLLRLIDSDIPIKDKVEIMEQFYIYVAEPVGPLKLEQKKKLLHMLRPIPEAIKKLKENCPDITDEIEQKISDLGTHDQNKILLYRKFQIYQNSTEMDEKNSLESWFNLALNLPYSSINPFPTTGIEEKMMNLQATLDKELYGMEKFKVHILAEINRYLHNPKNTRNIALKGPPGIGKTRIVQIVSKAIDIPFYPINVGGIDIDSLIGCNYAYRGAHEGEITRALRSFGSQSNGIIYFDEYEKVGSNGIDSGSRDAAAVQTELLRITDKTQNSRFKDLYLMGLEQDVSNVLFICSMNENPINKPMLDRLTVIEMDGYQQKDKIAIAKRHLIPDALAKLDMTDADIKFDNSVLHHIAVSLEDEKGVRQFENVINFIVNQLYFLMTNPNIKPIPLMENVKIGQERPIVVGEYMYRELKKAINIDKKWLAYII